MPEDARGSPAEDPFEIAVEHIAWEIGRGRTPKDILLALAEGHRPDSWVTWNDALLAVVEEQQFIDRIVRRRTRVAA